jgi:hypothetical protein
LRRNGLSICRTVVSEMYGPATPADISLMTRFTCLHERRRTHHNVQVECDSDVPPSVPEKSVPCRRCLRARLFLLLFSADSAKDRSVANVRRLAVFLQPFGHLAANQRIRQMVRRPRCAPQFNRSLSCPLVIWLLARCGRGGGHLTIKPVEKILFDDRK